MSNSVGFLSCQICDGRDIFQLTQDSEKLLVFKLFIRNKWCLPLLILRRSRLQVESLYSSITGLLLTGTLCYPPVSPGTWLWHLWDVSLLRAEVSDLLSLSLAVSGHFKMPCLFVYIAHLALRRALGLCWPVNECTVNALLSWVCWTPVSAVV